MFKGTLIFLSGFAAGVALVAPRAQTPGPPDNQELTKICAADQADRNVPYKQIDWTVVSKRDTERLKRVKEIYAALGIHTANDLDHAALVLQHSSEPDDFLLAHELEVVAISKGLQNALWLAAASEDRFLMNINRPQRFGTQFRADGPKGEFYLYKVDPAVTDQLRAWMRTPTLAEAKNKAEELKRTGG